MVSLPGVFSARYRLITIGSIVLVFVAAFENLAVTTVMPVISGELEGAALYAVAFAGPLGAAVFGMVVAGLWCDRSGPRMPLYVAVAAFVAGLLVAGSAVSMEAVVAGRLIQGVGGGGVTVALFVIVARVYPAVLQPRIFGLFAAAWVVPALVGPSIAGLLGETVGWRWVFLGVAGVALPALALVVPVMRTLAATDSAATADTPDAGHAPGPDAPRLAIGAWLRASTPRILLALVLALAILGLSVSTEFEGAAVLAIAGVSLVVAVLVLRPLLPRGTLLARPGLPSVILTRGLLAAGYFTVEVYLPYLFTAQYALTPTLAGLALTVAGVAWGASSLLQGRIGTLGDRTAVRLGVLLVLVAVGTAVATAALHLPVGLAIAGWAVSGVGMGLAYPRLSVLMIGSSKPAEQGFNSAALAIADSSGPAISLAVSGILFHALAGPAAAAFGTVFGLALLITAVTLTLAGRVAPALRR